MNEALRLKVAHDRRLRALDEFLAAFEAERLAQQRVLGLQASRRH